MFEKKLSFFLENQNYADCTVSYNFRSDAGLSYTVLEYKHLGFSLTLQCIP